MIAIKTPRRSKRHGDATGERLPMPLNWDALRRMCVEYLEMPGLRLTREQVQRLLGLDEAGCTELLDALVTAAFLRRLRDGKYART